MISYCPGSKGVTITKCPALLLRSALTGRPPTSFISIIAPSTILLSSSTTCPTAILGLSGGFGGAASTENWALLVVINSSPIMAGETWAAVALGILLFSSTTIFGFSTSTRTVGVIGISS